MILEARKGGEKLRAKTLSLVKAELIYNDKSKKPMKEIQVVQSYVKKLEKASCAFKKTDKYNGLVAEMKIIQALLPQPMGAVEIKEAVANYFGALEDPKSTKPGIAIGQLKAQLGDHNGSVIAPAVMTYLKDVA